MTTPAPHPTRVIFDGKGKPLMVVEAGRQPLGFQPPKPPTFSNWNEANPSHEVRPKATNDD